MAKIKSIENVGRHQTYDLEVDHKDHQFYLSNGLLTSNSHSHTYSVMTMQCAHLATYYPVEFYTAVLTKGQASDLQDYIVDIQKRGFKILPVDVNLSKMAHVIESSNGVDCIRLSLSSVLGVGEAAIQNIMAGQPYSDFLDFLTRSGVSKTAIMPLIQVGAFDSLYPNIKDLEEKYNDYAANPKWRTKKNINLWHERWSRSPVEDYQDHEKVLFENALMGFSLRGSPFKMLNRDEKLDKLLGTERLNLEETLEVEDDIVVIPVVLKEFKERPQKNKQMMAFLKFGLESGEELEVPCFSTIWKWVHPKCQKGSVYIATFNRREDDPTSLVLGKPGFKHTMDESLSYMINLDEVNL